MTKRKSLFLVAILATLCSCRAQQPDWSKSKNWKVYAITGQKIFNLSSDTLQALSRKALDNDSLHYFLSKATIVPKERTPVWMGAYLSSYETEDGKEKKVEISDYGGFFYDEASELYYVIPRSISNEWMDYISTQVTLLRSKK
ncbi:hypothetical protein [Puia dinghuensis]|nr:hypothetical protein [Puia dinghuensis]